MLPLPFGRPAAVYFLVSMNEFLAQNIENTFYHVTKHLDPLWCEQLAHHKKAKGNGKEASAVIVVVPAGAGCLTYSVIEFQTRRITGQPGQGRTGRRLQHSGRSTTTTTSTSTKSNDGSLQPVARYSPGQGN
ncbi:uncharacterized protein LOC108103208 [Drosophila eugracilis]|uniref:uncharacterized protein LOC108103208 n=1 Tax=Drosophila eugracilis TaxID=29029 RepID=UPI0007E66592|nr:uncharacterized protein LOC108103208 [Drosophila eugracilis]